MASTPRPRRSSPRRGTRLPLLLLASPLALLALPFGALAENAPPENMPHVDALKAPPMALPDDAEEQAPDDGNTQPVNDSTTGLFPSVPAIEETETAAPHSSTRILEELHSDQRVIRHYTRITSRDTSIRRRQRTHTIQDRVREDLEVELRYGLAVEDPARIQVRVLKATESSPSGDGPLNAAIPEQGLLLYCWQVDFDSLCREATTRKEVDWPQWAVLDFSSWTTSATINVGKRWRHLIPDADSAGWTEGHNKQTRATFEVQRSNSDPNEGTTLAEGVLETEGELMVYSEARRFPATGELELEFDHETKLVERFLIHWKGDVSFEGVIGREAYEWDRKTKVRLLITSSSEPEL